VNRRNRTIMMISAFILGLVFQATLQAQSPTDPRVDTIMNSVIKPNEPGASVIVIQDGRIIHEAGYGLADLQLQKPNTPQTLYHMASTGKQFSSMGIMMMKEHGLLNYDDPIAVHLPQLSRFGTNVTLAELMHHTSGIPDYYNSNLLYNVLLSIDPTPDNDDALLLLQYWGLLKQGGKWVYSNAGYDTLGTLIQHKSGQSFDSYMQQHIFQPLGMNGTFSLPNPIRFADPNRARGYDKNSEGWVVNDSDPLDELVGSGSIYSSVQDLYAYDQALYTNQLVMQSTLAAAFQPAKTNDGIAQYGFGWYLGKHRERSYTSHGGYWEGYRSYILRFINNHFSVFVLANRTDISPEDLAFRIFDVFEPSL
jgi:CubicO group peptidase (beta-lactamase class C family)